MPLKILFSEASSTSARQTLYALGPLGYVIDICDPQRLCLGRFSRYVRRYYRCPSFTADPAGYVRFLDERLRQEHYDVLLPVHDQVYLLARFRDALGSRTGLALPRFEAVEQLQSKAAFYRLLEELGISQPRTTVLCDPEQLKDCREYPCYVKLAYGTAGCGVWLVRDDGEMKAVAATLRSAPCPADGREIVVQQVVGGVFHAAQAVFQHGKLAGAHCYRARAPGVGGSAHARQSVAHPLVYEHLARLGAHLEWHGALHTEYFCDEDSGNPIYIEANPRIGETLNATLSGVNLCDLLVRVSLGQATGGPIFSRPGVKTHSVLMSMMGAAERGAGRRAILAELRQAWAGRGVYEESQDELTRPREDFWSLLPACVVTGQLLAAPRRVRRIVRRAVDNYALTETAIRRIREVPTSVLGLGPSVLVPGPST